ncbi:hypothetical protein BTE77_06530 [Ensifer adhaerens]|nr:hypothetical protein BTE77_06530 [Ensifer adhaerens]
MKRSDVEFTLRMMEQCRHLQMEAETRTEAKRLSREYSRMWKGIEPYIKGNKPYSDDVPTLI